MFQDRQTEEFHCWPQESEVQGAVVWVEGLWTPSVETLLEGAALTGQDIGWCHVIYNRDGDSRLRPSDELNVTPSSCVTDQLCNHGGDSYTKTPPVLDLFYSSNIR